MKPHPEAIIFDLYGVLAINGWLAFKAAHFADGEAAWGKISELGRQVDAGLAEYDDFIRLIAHETGADEPTVRYQLEHTVANEPLLRYIAVELKSHYKIGLLSNASNDTALHIFTPQELSLFDATVFSHHTGFIKPQPEMYEAGASKLGVEPGECVFVDDQERHVTGAREAGMHGILYTDMAALKQSLAEVLA